MTIRPPIRPRGDSYLQCGTKARAAVTVRVLFTRGLPDDNSVRLMLHEGEVRTMISGCSNVRSALASRLASGEVLFMGDGPKQSLSYSQLPSLVFNEIGDPDTHRLSLQRAIQFCDHLDLPILNSPSRIAQLTRDHISKSLADQHECLRVPRTIRISLDTPGELAVVVEAEGMEPTIEIRTAGPHGGTTFARIDSLDDLSALHALPLDGRQFYVVETVDYRASDNYYHTYRIAMVNGQPFVRHETISEDPWFQGIDRTPGHEFSSLGADKEGTLQEFESELRGRLRTPLDIVDSVVGLDYYGVDVGLDRDGSLVLLDINAHMNILHPLPPRPNRRDAAVTPIVDALLAHIESAAVPVR